MSISNKYIKILISLLPLLSLSSCVGLDEGQEGGYGYLSVEGPLIDVSVMELVPTKSGTSTLADLGVTISEEQKPSLADVTFTLTGTEFSETWTGTHDVFTLKVGDYTLTASYNNGSNDGFGEPLYGETSVTVTVSPLTKTSASVDLPLANALVKFLVSDDLKGDFTPTDGAPVKFYEGETEAGSAALGSYVFVPAGKAVKAAVSGTNSAGVSSTINYDLPALTAKSARQVTFGKSSQWPTITWAEGQNLADGAFEGSIYFSPVTVTNMSEENKGKLKYQIKGGVYSDWTDVTVSDVSGYKYISGLSNGEKYSLRAYIGNIVSAEKSFVPKTLTECIAMTGSSAAHTTNASNELDGTTVSATFTLNFPTIISGMVSDLKMSGSYADGKRTFQAPATAFSNNSLSLTLDKANNLSWPYIPRGTYSFSLSPSCTLPGPDSSTRTITPDAASAGTIDVPAPTFAVTASANTTYSYYKDTNKGATEANKKTAENVFDVTSTVSISDDILEKSNYSKILPSVTYSVGGKTASGTYSSSKTHRLGTEITSLSWATHSLTATVTFDGTTVTSTGYPCVITGLPYDLLKNTCKDMWHLEGGTAEWNSTTINLNHSKDNSATLSFNVSGTIDVSINTSFSIYTPSRLAKPTLTISSGGTVLATIEGQSGTAVTKDFNDYKYQGNLNQSNQEIKYNRKYAYSREGNVWIKNLQVSYR